MTRGFRGRFFAACFTTSPDYAKFDSVARATSNKIDTRVREFVRVPEPGEIVTEIEAVHFPFSSGS